MGRSPPAPRVPFSPWWGSCARGGVSSVGSNVAYVNRTYVTVVNRNTFVSGGVVNSNIVRDRAVVSQVAAAAVLRGPIPVVPTRGSLHVAVRADAAAAPRPPAALASRMVVARTAPPPAPPTFQSKLAVITESRGAPVAPDAAARISSEPGTAAGGRAGARRGPGIGPSHSSPPMRPGSRDAARRAGHRGARPADATQGSRSGQAGHAPAPAGAPLPAVRSLRSRNPRPRLREPPPGRAQGAPPDASPAPASPRLPRAGSGSGSPPREHRASPNRRRREQPAPARRPTPRSQIWAANPALLPRLPATRSNAARTADAGSGPPKQPEVQQAANAARSPPAREGPEAPGAPCPPSRREPPEPGLAYWWAPAGRPRHRRQLPRRTTRRIRRTRRTSAKESRTRTRRFSRPKSARRLAGVFIADNSFRNKCLESDSKLT